MPYRDFVLPLLLVTGSVAAVTACAPDVSEQVSPIQGTGVGIDIEAIDKSVDPGDDFFLYANGNWLNATQIPADRSSTGSFLMAQERAEERLRMLVEEVAGTPQDDDTPEGMIARYYTAFMDQRAIDRRGLRPMRDDFRRYAAIDDVADLSRVLGRQMRADVDPLNATDFHTENLFGLFVTRALTEDSVVPYMLQGGLGLPSREYYLSDSRDMVRIRREYRDYIARMFGTVGVKDGYARADRIIALETAIARAHVPREQSEDFTRSAALWSRADFAEYAPGIDWDAFFGAASLGEQDRFAAYHADGIAGLSALVAGEPLDVWKDWLRFHRLSQYADVLPSPVGRAHFDFYGRVLGGLDTRPDRETLAIEALGENFGDALGRLYVDRNFSANQRRDIEIMVARVKRAFSQRVGALDWLAPATRREALEKVAGIEVGIGYPDRYDRYDGLQLAGKSAYGMTVAAEQAAYRRALAKIGKPLDRREWWLSPHVVNALNLPVQNALNFPAGILQRPFYDPEADPAANYGAIGAIIGHEISHSFDNNGAAFDADGRMRNWWGAADAEEFRRRGQDLAEQYSRYRPFADAAVDGQLTLGENIADLAGLTAAYDAYRASLRGKEPPVIEGFTGDQRFFIAYAQAWATKTRDARLRAQLATDGHAPGRYRAATVRNLDAWYRAFDVEEGDALYLAPEDRITIW